MRRHGQAEAQALRKSVGVLEQHLLQKRQGRYNEALSVRSRFRLPLPLPATERQQSEVQSKFLRQRITELTEEVNVVLLVRIGAKKIDEIY